MRVQLHSSADPPRETVSRHVQHIWLKWKLTNLSLEGHANSMKEGKLSSKALPDTAVSHIDLAVEG